MKTTFKVSLKADERIYINGAVLRVDRKTSIEFLNDVNFLLENHVIQAAGANTPLRQLYYFVQIMLMDPKNLASTFELYRLHLAALFSEFESATVRNELKIIDGLIHEGFYFDAMKAIRSLFEVEAGIMGGQAACVSRPAELPGPLTQGSQRRRQALRGAA